MKSTMKIIKKKINEILEMKGEEGVLIDDNSKLVQDLGLKSLDLAQLIAMLEIEFDYDPFTNGFASLDEIKTVVELSNCYIETREKEFS